MKNEKNKKSKVQQIGISLLILIVATTLACTKKADANKAEDGSLTITSDGGKSDESKSVKSYYTTANLRLRSEPDTSKDNRIASVPQGSKVELIETGKTETIDAITAPWFKVKTADGTVGWLFSGYLTETDYSKILKGDFSDFAGEWYDGEAKYFTLNEKGNLDDVSKSSDFKKESDEHYTWKIKADSYNRDMKLFPVGVDIVVNNEIIQSDKTKVRIISGDYYKGKYDPSLNPIFYLTSPRVAISTNVKAVKPESFDKILKGDFSDFAGTWVSSSNGRKQFYANGAFYENWVASGFEFDKTDGSYKWNIDTAGFEPMIMFLYPIGIEIKRDGEIIQSDITKVRLGDGFGKLQYIYYQETK